MYLVITTFLILVLYFYWSAIVDMFKRFNSTAPPSFSLGTPWFVSILIVNVIVLCFLLWFYYSKLGNGSEGKKGSMGTKGFQGQDGPGCIVGCS